MQKLLSKIETFTLVFYVTLYEIIESTKSLKRLKFTVFWSYIFIKGDSEDNKKQINCKVSFKFN